MLYNGMEQYLLSYHFNVLLQLLMFEKVNQAIHNIKNHVSIKFINTHHRDKVFSFLNHISEQFNQGLIATEYIKEIEDNHDNLMAMVSKFIDQLSYNLLEYTQMYEELHQDHLYLKKLQIQQTSSSKLDLSDLCKKIEYLNDELICKQQQIRELHVKLQSKQGQIDNMDRESTEYLKKVEHDLTKQHNMLEESYLMVRKYQEEIEELKAELEGLRNMDRVTVELANTNHNHQMFSKPANDRSSQQQFDQRCPSDNSDIIKYSAISSISSEDQHLCDLYEQANSIGPLHSLHQTQNEPPNIHNLKEMLSISIEKEYKLQYINSSIEQNGGTNEMKQGQRDGKRQSWRHNMNSQDGRVRDSSDKLYIRDRDCCAIKSVQEFQLCNILTKNVDTLQNPYYTYFIIACQNIKIRSPHFEQLSKINNTEHLWLKLLQSKLALHKWQQFLQESMIKDIPTY